MSMETEKDMNANITVTKHIHKKENNQFQIKLKDCFLCLGLQVLLIMVQIPGSDMHPEATAVTLEPVRRTGVYLPIIFTLSQLHATCSFSQVKKSFRLNFQLFCTAGTV